jgi:hypothetical protein
MRYKAGSSRSQGTDFYEALKTYIRGCVVCVLQKVRNLTYIYEYDIYGLRVVNKTTVGVHSCEDYDHNNEW